MGRRQIRSEEYWKEYHKAYHRSNYAKNKAKMLATAKASATILIEFIRKVKDVPCTDCGVRYPYYVMQFDHIRGNKIGNINRLLTQHNKARLVEEIAKCEVVCANCHAVRTWERRGK